jgi:AmmeMemoRadiSam system protein A
MTTMNVLFMPHPPVAIPEVGGGKERAIAATLEGYKALANKVAHIRPSTIVVITPHGQSFSNGVSLLGVPDLQGDLSLFGVEGITLSKKLNIKLAHLIQLEWEAADDVSVLLDEKTAHSYGVSTAMDHGALVPLWFIESQYQNYALVHITTSGQGLLEHYKLGMGLKRAIDQSDETVVVLCSGDLSHALTNDGPYTYNPYGSEFDHRVVQAIKDKKPELLLSLDHQALENAAQCGLKSFLMGFGLMDGYDYASEVLSYEGPFGVGYLTGYLANDFTTICPSKLNAFEAERQSNFRHKTELEDDYVKIARRSIDFYIKTGRKLDVEGESDFQNLKSLAELRSIKAGSFVSIHKDGALRGCMGTIEGVTESLLDEIIYNAISACSKDPRFNPIEIEELMALDIKVDRLYEAELISDLNQLDVKKYGVIVEKGLKRGLLLPNLEGISTVEEQVRIAMEKARINTSEGVTYYRFEVERHG